MRWRRGTVLVALGLAGALWAAAPAGALTRDQANQVALQTLHPDTEVGRAILFGLPKALGPKQSVVEADANHLGNIPRKGLPKLGKKAWLFWEDLYPDALFVHPSQLLLVDDATGRVSKNVPLSWYPLVDGKMPAFLLTDEGYHGPTYQVFTNIEPESAARGVGPLRTEVPRPAAPPADAFKDDCLLMVGLVPQPQGPNEPKKDRETREKEVVDKTLSGLKAAGAAVGLNGYYATMKGPSQSQPGSNDDQVSGVHRPNEPKGLSLAGNVDHLAKKEKCKDVLIYILGHGIAEKDTEVNGHTLKGSAEPAIVVGQGKAIFAKDLKKIAKAHAPGTEAPLTFKFIFDTCYAERFKPPVFEEPNVVIAIAAAKKDQPSLMSVKGKLIDATGKEVKAAAANPGWTEFGFGMGKSFEEVTGNDAEFNAAIKPGGDKLAQVLKAAFPKSKKYDRGQIGINPATKEPYTTPDELDRLPVVEEKPCEGKTKPFNPGRRVRFPAAAAADFEFIAIFDCPDEVITQFVLEVQFGSVSAFLPPQATTCTKTTIDVIGRPARLAAVNNALRCIPSSPIAAGTEVSMNVRVDQSSPGDVTVSVSPDNGQTFDKFLLTPQAARASSGPGR